MNITPSAPMLSRRLALHAGCAATASLLGLVAARQAFAQPATPTIQQLRILCSGPAGSIPDIVARRVAEQLTRSQTPGSVAIYPQGALVDNRPGAAGQISVNALKASTPDGATVLLAQGAVATTYPQQLLSDQLGAMLAASLEPEHQPPATVARRSLVESATKILLEHLDHADVTADGVAAQLGVSVRTLHRSFAANQQSFASTLRQLRLARAAHLLAQPRLARVTIAELSSRCGFADASHFVREFAQVFGTTPARWRKQRAPS